MSKLCEICGDYPELCGHAYMYKRIDELEQQLTELREAAQEFFNKETGGAAEAYAAKDRLKALLKENDK